MVFVAYLQVFYGLVPIFGARFPIVLVAFYRDGSVETGACGILCVVYRSFS